MKRLLLGILIGLFLGWLTVPVVEGIYSVSKSDGAATYPTNDDDDYLKSHAYKWYLTQMLQHITSVDKKLTDLNDNMKAIKDKLHA